MRESICVIGLGYIGLPTSLILAASGEKVTGVDCKEEIVTDLKCGEMTFKEDGLESLYAKAIENGIVFTTDYPLADIYIVAVPTPYIKKSKKIDAQYLVRAVGSVVQRCDEGAIIVIESTVSPGTIDRYIRPLLGERNIDLVHAPERIIPGNMVNELCNNNRVIGADRESVAKDIKDLYSVFCKGEIVITDIKTAEMVKVVENTYRDINIAYANELTKICREAGLDAAEIINIANMHPRVNVLSPGPGVGGHCISVDPWFLVGDYPGLANLILTARKINDSMPEYVLKRASEIMVTEGINDVSAVGLYGITYKENVDDIRESPTLQMIEVLKEHLMGELKCYDPMLKTKIVEGQIMDFDEFLDGVEVVIVMVGHKHIIERQAVLKNKIVLDTKNVINEMPVYHLW